MAERKLPNVDDFPSASINKETRPAVRKKDDVIQVRKRRSFMKEVKHGMIGDDNPTREDYYDLIFNDVMFPALRDMISDIGHGFLDMALGTDSRGRYRNRRGGDRSYISYDRYYDDRPSRRRRYDDDDDDDYRRNRRRSSRRVPSNEDLDEFIIVGRDNREAKLKARDLLNDMRDQIEEYGDVSVAYFLDRVGESVAGDSVSNSWGWYNLDNASIKPAYGGGYHIIFPKMRPI